MIKKQKYLIFYLAVLLGLGIAHVNNPQPIWITVIIPIFTLYAAWDLFLHPLKYYITPYYLANEVAQDTVDIKCFYNKTDPTSVYCKVNNGKFWDGYRELPLCVVMKPTQTINDLSNAFASITDVHDLLIFIEAANPSQSRKYNYWLTDSKSLAVQSFIGMIFVDIVFVFIYLLNNQTEFNYYFY